VCPNPTRRKCFKLEKKEEEKEKRRRGESKTVSDCQAIINKILFMAQEGKKIYVLSYSKEFIKDLCYAFQMNDMGDKIQDYTSDTDDNVKRWYMSNVSTSWKRYQVVAATGTVGAGINFLEKHFDIVAIIGHSSTAEAQFQLLHRVRHTKENKLYLWIDRPGEGKNFFPSKKQIRKELDKKHEDGKKMSPSLLSMPLWLKNLYICELQEMHRSKRNQTMKMIGY